MRRIQHQRCVANFFEIVKGFGMFPNKYARVGTSVHCLPSLKSQSVRTPAVLAILRFLIIASAISLEQKTARLRSKASNKL